MQYLNGDDLLRNLPIGGVNVDDLISADSYNEEEILKKLNTIDDDGKLLLLKCAIHISIIGSGNKTFGSIRDKDNKVLEIKNIFDKYKIFYNKNISEKYDKSAISSRRLVRLFRFHIQKFIIETKRPSYLWLKYSERDVNMVNTCFPGAEHLVDNEKEANYLINTYKNLDLVLNTRFVNRLERIFIARRIFKPSQLLLIKKEDDNNNKNKNKIF